MIIRMPIDTKSLYMNIKNDNLTGHTATVATPLRQGNSIHEELAQILEIPECIGFGSRERLVGKLLEKSRVDAKIVKVFVFDNICVNGNPISVKEAYCIYIREETNPQNVHYGRQKVHYPQVLQYEDDDITVDNQKVMNAISHALHDYAFIVQAFEYDTQNNTLNFDALIVGENKVPYSKVFINRRGVGEKFANAFTYNCENYDTEIISLREKMGYDAVTPENYQEIVAENDQLACKVVFEFLSLNGAMLIHILKDDYPYSLYDIVYSFKNKRKYAIVQQTATKEKSFTLPIEKVKFLDDFKNESDVFLITDIRGNPKIHEYNVDCVNSLKKTISSIRFVDRGEGNG